MEAEFLSWLNGRVAPNASVLIGIGDDAAVVRAAEQLVVATDLLCDGVHFLSDESPLRLIGRKALAVNLSDFAAMAAVPQFAVVALLWPRDRPWQDACEVYEGLLELADGYDVVLVGGDTNRWDGKLTINVTLLGRATDRGVLTRKGARVGDAILVSGTLGGSLAGHHLTFEPRVRQAQQLHRQFEIHSAMDITDGLLIDLERMMRASNSGAEIELASVPVSVVARQLQDEAAAGRDLSVPIGLQHALTDGEDFELLITTDRDTATRLLTDPSATDLPLTQIGTVIEQPGVFHVQNGCRTPITVSGYLH